MAALRRTHLAHFLIALSCSSASPSTSGAVSGVLAIEQLDCQSNQCIDEDVAGAALAPSGSAWITRNTSSGDPNSDSVQLEVAAFDGDAGASVVKSVQLAAQSEVAVAPDGSMIYFAGIDSNGQLVWLRTVTPAGAETNMIKVSAGSGYGAFGGMEADTEAAIVALAQTGGPGGGANDPDQGYWLQNVPSTTIDVRSGVVARVNTIDGGVTTQNASFVMTYSHHLLAVDANKVYWVGGGGGATAGQVQSLPRDLSATTPTGVGDIPSGEAPVGLAVANGNVAWSSTADLLKSTPGCWIWVNSVLVFQSSTSWCMGLAIDATDAYFATVELHTATTNQGPENYIAGTGIARVSLTGPAQQTPHVVPITSQRLYGPRRVLVDATYVYGIDPAYVLRAAKTAFP